MQKVYCCLLMILLPAYCFVNAQDIRIKPVLKKSENSWRSIISLAQDQQGFIWFSTDWGMYMYDGVKTTPFIHSKTDSNSIASNDVSTISIDANNVLWIGTYNAGVDRYDPATGLFTHYRHDPKNSNSITEDTIQTLLADKNGNIWIGTRHGLDFYNTATKSFTHYKSKENDTSTLSNNRINVIYEDKKGVIWIGCGRPYEDEEGPGKGGLNRFDRVTGKFTRYLHDPKDPNSIEGNRISSLFEDSKGNFWVGTNRNGLHTLNRQTGAFTHYYYDAKQPDKLSRPVWNSASLTTDFVCFINEDAKGGLWIGTNLAGINRYDTAAKKITHYGYALQGLGTTISVRDTSAGFDDFNPWASLNTKDGLFWICTLYGNLHNVNFAKTIVPYYPIRQLESNSLYAEPDGKTLWIATDDGLLQKDLVSNKEKLWTHDPKNKNSLATSTVYAVKPGGEGKLWLGTVGGGLDLFDPAKGSFTHYRHDDKNPGSIGDDFITALYIDHQKNTWVSTGSGISKIDAVTKKITNYRHIDGDSNSLVFSQVYCMTESKDHSIWAGTDKGLDRLNIATGKFSHYLENIGIKAAFTDSKGTIWAGGLEGLFYLDSTSNQFINFSDQKPAITGVSVLGIIEDNNGILWVNAASCLIRLNPANGEIKKYGEGQGIKYNNMGWCDNFKATDGRLFIGHFNGYYSFYPEQIRDEQFTPVLHFTNFILGDKEIKTGQDILPDPLWKTKTIHLNYNQDIFSFGFIAIDYSGNTGINYSFMLENYDNTWHNIEKEHRAFFYNIPPGNYILHVKATNDIGISAEKSISIIISPPWWKTWWAYTLFALAFIGITWAFIAYRSKALRTANKLLEQKVTTRTVELQKEKEKVEHTLSELKSTQAQLIQSEKMASLGELTAGIAHEIQNPLNFVNNFSDVNKELLAELKDEIQKGNVEEANAIADDVINNSEKINHHGKRADAIVKGMLQHSRKSEGSKEPTDINKLCDEYLRLSYHGLRAKDKSFNATLQTDFDESIGKINIIPQDIGRVLLNLFNNAFYAVNEKQKQNPTGYDPTVSISTKAVKSPTGELGVCITVSDNGNGIPSNIIDKIFQPFFTTKPTGSGTGLGLSLAYDVVKAHGGEMKVESKEGEETIFIIYLSAS